MSGMITSLLQTVDTVSQQFVIAGYQSLVQAYSPAIYALVGLSVSFYGYAMVSGWVSLSGAEFIKRVFIIGLVVSFALHWDFFSEYFYNLFTNAPNEIGMVIVKAIPNSQMSDQTSVYSALQQAFYNGLSYGTASWDHGGMSNLAPYFWAIGVYLLTFIFATIAVVDLIAAKFGMAIYLVLAPLIIPTFLFPATKSALFDGWLRHLISFALIPIYIMSTISLCLMLMASPSSGVQSAIQSDSLTMTNLSGYVLCIFIMCCLLLIATSMAVSTAGGISTSLAHRLENTATSIRQGLMRGKKGQGKGDNNYNITGDGNHLHFHGSNDTPPPNPKDSLNKESNK